ncbi:MAG: hypothetical protein SGJ01_15350 [Gemmatimonadota bacterium]|nr:hypothetical protein [Gemmatimonadota bacterium]
MTEVDWPSIHVLGAPRYTVEDFAETEPQADALGWGFRVATVTAIVGALTTAGLGVPVAGLLLLGVGGLLIGVFAIMRDGLAWAWLSSSRSGVAAVIASASVLMVAATSALSGPGGSDLWAPAMALVR